MPPPPVIRVFSLPELAIVIVHYLDTKDVVACSAVSKALHGVFVPFVWQDLHFGKDRYSRAIYSMDKGLTPLARNLGFWYKPIIGSISHSPNKQEQAQGQPQEQNQEQNQGLQRKKEKEAQEAQEERGRQDFELLRSLQEKAPLIKSISIRDQDSILPFKLGSVCTRLESITLDGLSLKNAKHTKEHWDACKTMVARNRNHIKSLHLIRWFDNWEKKPLFGQPVWNPILRCRASYNLRSLTLENTRILGRHMSAFWAICKRLETLRIIEVCLDLTHPQATVGNTGLKGEPKITEKVAIAVASESSEMAISRRATSAPISASVVAAEARLPLLRTLVLHALHPHTSMRQLEQIIDHCPVLETLDWKIACSSPIILADFIVGFEEKRWPELDSICITSYGVSISEKAYHRLIQAATDRKKFLRRLDMPYHFAKPETFTLMQPHYATLESLDISRYTYLDPCGASAQVIEILTLCPNLQRFHATLLRGQDIIESKPFVCKSLRDFRLFIDMEFPNNGSIRRFSTDEIQQCRAVFKRLSVFKDLRQLDLLHTFDTVSTIFRPPSSSRLHAKYRLVPLPFRIKAGLDLLAGLTRLERVCFWGGRQKVHMEDIVWMVKHWKDLKSLIGRWRILWCDRVRRKDDFFVGGKIYAYLKKHGISTSGSNFNTYYFNPLDDIECVDCYESSDVEEEKVVEEANLKLK